MSTHTLTRPDVFPNGTVVGAYLPPATPGAALGSAVNQQTVASDAVTFTGLTAGTRYIAHGSNGKELSFTVAAAAVSAGGTPDDGSVTNAKVAADAAIAESKLALASDAAAGTASRRTLGTSATQAAAGNDSRLSDSRAPSGTAGGVLAGTFPNPSFAGLAPGIFRSGMWYGGAIYTTVSQSTQLNGGRGMFVPFVVTETTAFDRIGLEVAGAGAAGTLIRLGVYAGDGAGHGPGTLKFDAGTIVGDAVHANPITINQTLTPGLYWLVAKAEGGNPTVKAASSSTQGPPCPPLGRTQLATGDNKPVGLIDTSFGSGALPNPYAGSASAWNEMAYIHLRAT